MLIRALCDFYDVLAAEGKVLEKGFSAVPIQYAVSLSPDGKITGITNMCGEDNINKKGKVCKVPLFKNERSLKAYRIDHRPKYIFGLSYDSKTDSLSVTDKLANEKFKEKNLEFIEGMDEPLVNAFRNFLTGFVPENETENPIILEKGKELSKNPGLCFVLDGFEGKYLHETECIVEKVRSEAASEEESEDERVCAISGKKGKIARTHADVKGILGQKAGTFVCVKGSAGESFGKTQAYTSNISEESMSKYTEAFNYLTSSVDPNTQKYTNKAYIDAMTVIFFAADKNSEKEDAFLRFFAFDDSINADKLAPQVQSVMGHIQKGDALDINEIVTDGSADYYVAGLVPNSSRVCMKFCYRDSFGKILENVLRHQRDISIVGMGDKPVTIYQLANELVRPVPKGSKETSEDVPPPLLSALIESVFMGRRYPDSLYNTVINRVKTDKDSKVKDNDDKKTKGKKAKDTDTKDNDKTTIKSVKVNARRAGLIKAYLNRNYKEDFTMALDENRKDTAYLCGRLFAVLEYIQTKAQGNELNTTIKDSYFATACTTPAVVFPQMVLLAQNHLKKIESEQARKLDNRMAWLINDIEDFPATFSNKEQGVFILGYFQQRCFRYEKNQDTDETIQ